MERIVEKVTLAGGSVVYCQSMTALEAGRVKRETPITEGLEDLVKEARCDLEALDGELRAAGGKFSAAAKKRNSEAAKVKGAGRELEVLPILEEFIAVRGILRLARKVQPRVYLDEGCTQLAFSKPIEGAKKYTVGQLRSMSEGILLASMRGGGEESFRGGPGGAPGTEDPLDGEDVREDTRRVAV